MKTVIFDPMLIKAWTPDEVRGLVNQAKSMGIKQGTLVDTYIGVSVQALQNWMDPNSGVSPDNRSRRALTFAEVCLTLGVVPVDALKVAGKN